MGERETCEEKTSTRLGDVRCTRTPHGYGEGEHEGVTPEGERCTWPANYRPPAVPLAYGSRDAMAFEFALVLVKKWDQTVPETIAGLAGDLADAVIARRGPR